MQLNVPLFPEQASGFARNVDQFYLFLVLITTFFSLLVALLILFFIIKYRKRPGVEAEQIHGSMLLEVVWTVIPLGISMVGGLLLSQILTLYTTPVVYVYLDRFRAWLRTRTAGGKPILIPQQQSI